MLPTYVRTVIPRPLVGGQKEVSLDQTQRCRKEPKEPRQSSRSIIPFKIGGYTLVKCIGNLNLQSPQAVGQYHSRIKRISQPHQHLAELSTYSLVWSKRLTENQLAKTTQRSKHKHNTKQHKHELTLDKVQKLRISFLNAEHLEI